MCIETKGYLYSYHTHSFVCNQNNIVGMDREPLLVTMRVPGHATKSGWKTHKFEVISFGHHKNNGHRRHHIEMNMRGEVKLRLRGKCEAIYNGRLSIEKCSPSNRQVFTWIPEHLFSDFVERLHNRGQKHHGRRDLRNSRVVERNKDHRHKKGRKHLNDAGGNLKNIRGAVDGVKKTLVEAKKPEGIPKGKCDVFDDTCTNDGKYGHLNDKIFNDYLDLFCKTNPVSGYCQNYFHGRDIKDKDSGEFCISKKICRRDKPHKKEMFIKQARYDMEPILDKNFIKNLTGILQSSGKCMDVYNSPIYESKAKRPRTRGIFGRGDDSEELSPLECRCKFECIRNPNNGMCYYKADPSGKLVPIMGDENCCSNKRKEMCNIGNKIDKYLCELTIKNDYSSFSKFLDQNYACS